MYIILDMLTFLMLNMYKSEVKRRRRKSPVTITVIQIRYNPLQVVQYL